MYHPYGVNIHPLRGGPGHSLAQELCSNGHAGCMETTLDLGVLVLVGPSYKTPLYLSHYNFRKVTAIDFLFSTLHTTLFHYGKIHFGVLH